MIGSTLGHFRITELLGEGGMGRVYRGADTRLGRDVAIKVLPEAVAGDAERLARFEREAKVLASLNHPHIAAVYSFETATPDPPSDAGPVHFLVMELVEGETLAQRVARGHLVFDRALEISRQVAEALQAAHEKGIIHRDLKPGNVMVDAADQVKVLDFGLAKALAGDMGLADSEVLSLSPTLTQETRAGVILGTAGYMSPEQARGLPVDRRADIWAFGCLCFELLTGRQGFPGSTSADIFAKILEREPDWEALPASTPVPIRRMLRRCLVKDAAHRLQDIGDARLEIEEVLGGETAPETAMEVARQETRGAAWMRWLPWGVALVTSLLSIWALVGQRPRQEGHPVVRFQLPAKGLALGIHPVSSVVALSPDGSTLAYVEGGGDQGQIYLRRIDSLEAVPVQGAENAQAPFFSPDGQWLGFAAEGELRKVRIDGGKVWSLCDVEVMHGADWATDGTIVFSGQPGLLRVSENGGEPETVTLEDPDRDEVGHHCPHLLPGEDKVVFVTVGGGGEPLEIAWYSMRSGERKTVVEGGSNAAFLSSGHLLYGSGGELLAVPFDPESGTVSGSPVAAVHGIMMGFSSEPGRAHFAVSDTGTLAYVEGPAMSQGLRMVKADREGRIEPIGEPGSDFWGPKISPDGSALAVTAVRQGQNQQIWLLDFRRDTFRPITFGDEQTWWPLWSPDGEHLAVTRVDSESGSPGVFLIRADGRGEPEMLVPSDLPGVAQAWSPDGSTLIIHSRAGSSGSWDIFSVDVAGGRAITPMLVSEDNEYLPALAPDGRWLAYVSDETGRPEIYVRSYPDLQGKWLISTAGGKEPLWSPRGDELFYRQDSSLMSVPIEVAESFSAGRPQQLFSGGFQLSPDFGRNYDVGVDGRSFLLIEQVASWSEEAGLQVVVNWRDEFQQINTASAR